MQSAEFINKLIRDTPGHHRVYSPLEDAEVTAWNTKWPTVSMPGDLLALLRVANGIDLWVNDGSPDGYFRLLPLREIDAARNLMWGSSAKDLNDDDLPLPHWLAISEHQDGACYIVLDTDKQHYYLMDTCGADLTCPAGSNIDELLDYVWEHWIKPHMRSPSYGK